MALLLLGRFFLEFSFSCLENVHPVRSVSVLNPGILKLFLWTRDFVSFGYMVCHMNVDDLKSSSQLLVVLERQYALILHQINLLLSELLVIM